MRPVRVLAATASAAAALLAGCATTSNSGAGSPAAGGTTTAARPAGNGIAELRPDLILARAKTALRQAGTVRISARGRDGGSSFALDLRIKGNQGATGRVTTGGLTFTLLRISRSVYLKADAAVWQKAAGGQPEVARLLAGKWVKIPTGNADFKDIEKFTTLDALAALFTPHKVSPTDTVAGTTTRVRLRGVDAVRLTDEGTSVYVAAVGRPYPLRLQGPPSGKSDLAGFLFDFQQFGQPVPLANPPADQVIDLAQLGR